MEFTKKLNLTRETLCHLGNEDLNHVVGGGGGIKHKGATYDGSDTNINCVNTSFTETGNCWGEVTVIY
ncbi:hypothetical protein [Geothrix sp. PMB-07]|uniref:hypothetical protein n=1 Tax=Geothrix sp. PMB-07 TaxID=3068640 RepID=UPI0027424C64|nr:hypothetical protein [Geothrix sp. PMB-07]WLT31643.1 hypothetical protein Q9293_18225 [Geothrix sp. PMB-07]